MRTLEDVQNDNRKREEEVLAKGQRYVQRRKWMNIRLAIGGGFLALLGNLFYAYMAGLLLFVFMVPCAAGAGYLIGHLGLGRLLAMPVYALSQGLAMTLFFTLATSMTESIETGGLGGGIILFFTIAGYGVFGAVLGFCNELFDRNHMQV